MRQLQWIGQGELKHSGNPANKVLVFGSLGDFEPFQVIAALPALHARNRARGHIRMLQAKAEADESVARRLDAWLDSTDSAEPGQIRKRLVAAFGQPVQNCRFMPFPALQRLSNFLHRASDEPEAETLAELRKWSLVRSGDETAWATALARGRLLIAMASSPDTLENRGKARVLLRLLAAPAPADDTDFCDEEQAECRGAVDAFCCYLQSECATPDMADWIFSLLEKLSASAYETSAGMLLALRYFASEVVYGRKSALRKTQLLQWRNGSP